MAQAAGCSKGINLGTYSSVRLFGSVKVPPSKDRQQQSITPIMLEALCDHLLEKPDIYLDEMAIVRGTSSTSK